MTYSNGLGNLLHLLGNIAVNAAGDVKRADATASSNNQIALDNQDIDSQQSTDGTQFSSASSLLNAALALPDARLDKVSSLQDLIASGNYNISSSDVAGSILDALAA